MSKIAVVEREFDADHEKADPKDEYIQRNEDDGSTTILFQYPVVLREKGKDPITEITLKRPVVGDIEVSDAAKGEVKQTIMIIASLSGLPAAVIRRIDMEDFKRISDFLAETLGGEGKKSQRTGEG